MKKIATALLTIVLAIICAFGFTACEDIFGHDEGGENEGELPTHTNEVTEEEWESIFDSVDNYTITTPDDEMKVIKLAGDKYYHTYMDELGDGQCISIFVEEDNNYFYYKYSTRESGWGKYDLEEEYYHFVVDTNKEIFSIIFKDAYNAFTYSEGKYVCSLLIKTKADVNENDESVEEAVRIENIEIIFDNGKLVSINLESLGIKTEIKNIGTTVIELPTEYTDYTSGKKDPFEVTAEEWESILDGTDNFTMEGTYNGATVIIGKLAHGGIYAENLNVGMINICVKEGDGYTQYSYEDSAWTKAEITEENYRASINTIKSYISQFKDDFANFTYADGKYTCASLDKSQSDSATPFIITNIEISFENGVLKSMSFEFNGGFKSEIKFIGTTSFDIPDSLQ